MPNAGQTRASDSLRGSLRKAHRVGNESCLRNGAVVTRRRLVEPPMNAFFTLRPARATLPAGLLLATLLAAGVIPAPGAAQAAETGAYCLRQWPNDHNAYLLCQQLQNRNHLAFRHFLANNNLSERMLAQGRVPDRPVAKAAKYCLDHWSPDYQGIWNCTQRRTRNDP